jgi:hypothetical protein
MDFEFPALTYFSERSSERIPYLTLFPVGTKMRNDAGSEPGPAHEIHGHCDRRRRAGRLDRRRARTANKGFQQ